MTKLIVLPQLPKPDSFGESVLVIYDLRLEKLYPSFANWIKKFKYRYPVKSGESLKAVDAFPEHIRKLINLGSDLPSRGLKIVAVGGGSVGDFAGFVASVYKRGVELVHLPTTWLAAVDSAHGGKTALNVGSAKNQIGTFYPASQVYLIKSLLIHQPQGRIEEGYAEIFKIALLSGGIFWDRVKRVKKLTGENIWPLLPGAIAAKMKIVNRDPQEKKGLRHILNLGHTLGHVIEVLGEHSHGHAVSYGLVFAVEWSREQGILPQRAYDEVVKSAGWKLLRHPIRDNAYRVILAQVKKAQELLAKDKKKNHRSKIRFIFLSKVGRPLIHEVVPTEILLEVVRQQGSGRGSL